jgi:hypothetical protein
MIDSVTGKLVTVLIDESLGPYIVLHSKVDADVLEKLLSIEHYILYEIDNSSDPSLFVFYFGSLAVPDKLQRVLDRIVL